MIVLLKYFFNRKRNVFLYIILSVGVYACVTGIYQIYAMVTRVAEKGSYKEAFQVLLMSSVILISLLILMILSGLIKRFTLADIMQQLRSDLFQKTYDMKLHSYAEHDTAYYTSMLVNDIEMLESSYFDQIFELVGDCIQLFVMLFSITLIGWQYTLIVLLFALVSMIQPFMFKKKLEKDGVKVSEELEKCTLATKEYINSFEQIKSYKVEKIFANKYANSIDNLESSNNKLWTTKMWNSLFILISVYALKAGSQLFFAYSSIIGIIPVATVTLLFGLANNVGNPIVAILGYIEPIQSTKGVRKKILTFLRDTTVDEKNDGKQLNREVENIKLQEITFGYNSSKNVLDGLSVVFEKGKKYALVGESGSGKSTILKLLMGYYPNYKGKIMYDGEELSEISLASIRNNVSYITQSAYLFQDSIKNNITLNTTDCSEEEIHQIIQKVKLDELISQLPNGIDENIVACSNNFSGGEKQRIAIARAMVRKAKVVLIDEGASALDNMTALSVEQELLSVPDKTVISVVHRFNDSIRMYDSICFLENGMITEQGSYDELMKLKGKFYQMSNQQIGGNNE